jgi:hypothetical protein
MGHKRYELLLRELPPGSTIDMRRVAGARGRAGRKTGHHPVVYLPDGTMLRDDSGLPVTVAFSPSDHHAMRNCLARIRRLLRSRGLT